MIIWLKNWANQIIVAVIIATIFEMILPNGKNKKYINMIIGLYVLFTIMQPIVSKVTGNEFKINNFDYNKYFSDSKEMYAKSYEDNNTYLIEKTYLSSIEKDIKSKIEQKGYLVLSCNISLCNNSNENEYKSIKNINMQIEKKEKENGQIDNSINILIDNNINEVKINSNNTLKKNKKNITESERNILMEYLAKEYSIDKNNISIN